MCGIVVVTGPDAQALVEASLGRLRHRGPDDQRIVALGERVLGFTRLSINGQGAMGAQPYEHGTLVGAFNGEIYNHRQLKEAYGLPASPCDIHVVLPLLKRLGSEVLNALDGFYSGLAIDRETGEAWCLRDHMGKKPLFIGRSQGHIFITSELKAFDQIETFAWVPRGLSQIDLNTAQVKFVAEHTPLTSHGELVMLFERAVEKRLPAPDQPVGVFLSGGLDSSLVAAVVARHRPDAIYFTLGTSDAADRHAVSAVVSALGLIDVRCVPVPASSEIPDLVREVVYATESYNPSIISNGLGTYLLARAAHEAGIKVVLGGEGADELFGGYHRFTHADEPWREVRSRLIDDMQTTELRRLDLSAMAHSVEVRCPFLDRALRDYSDALDFSDMYNAETNKVLLRRTFHALLPPEVLERPKTSLDVGSGVRGAVVQHLRRHGLSEREELRQIWRSLFSFQDTDPYFSAYPVFDKAIDHRGESHRQ